MLHTLKPSHGSTKKRKRVARGNSAGGGTTAGRGTKGQQSRTGHKRKRAGFEGGQTPITRRLPKLGGFKNPNRVSYEALTVEKLEKMLEAGSYDITALRDRRLLTSSKPAKLLGNSKMTKKLELTVHAASKGAQKAVEDAGGTVTIIKQ